MTPEASKHRKIVRLGRPMTKQITYFKGDKAEYTGKVVVLHGGTFYEVVMLEGHMKGATKVVKNAPKIEATQ